MKKKIRVALFFGGTSDEREVSIRTGQTVARQLDHSCFEVIPIEVARNGKWLAASPTVKLIQKSLGVWNKPSIKSLVSIQPGPQPAFDVALLALHGPGGEDGTIQGMMELLHIPYTGSGVLASALAMDKARTKRLVAGYGVPVLRDVVISRDSFKALIRSATKNFPQKVVIKPNTLGSSIGITIASGRKKVIQGIKKALTHSDEVILEPFQDGREFTVPVLGNKKPRALPVIEILPWKRSKFYDYSAKYSKGGSEHVIPANLTREQTRKVQALAVTAHKALGCRGVTRSDFILSSSGTFYFLESNTIPGMTPTSLVPQSAQVAGIGFPKLLEMLLDLAFQKE